LEAPTKPNLYEIIGSNCFARETRCDIRDLETLSDCLANAAPDVIFHMAAQPLVRRSYSDPLVTFETNALGTAHLLEVIRRAEMACTIVVIATDKCYENQNWEQPYSETDALGGHDVYSMSKAAAELVVQSWRNSFFAPNPKLGNVASGRAGNVIGGGDYAEDRLVPDCIRALLAARPIEIRNPNATRPWQHVLDCLSGYLWLGARLAKSEKNSPLASAFNFGPDPQANQPVSVVVRELLRLWPGEWKHFKSDSAPHEAGQLNLAIDKAAKLLGWHPTWNFPEAIDQTVVWYRERHVSKSPDMLRFSRDQISIFTAAARKKGAVWATA
jgi:CDP-glucose 4,6-dehydratase